jgi:hypothetical protein
MTRLVAAVLAAVRLVGALRLVAVRLVSALRLAAVRRGSSAQWRSSAGPGAARLTASFDC